MASEEDIRETIKRVLREESLSDFKDVLFSWEKAFIDLYNGKLSKFPKDDALKCSIWCAELIRYLEEIENKQ